MNNSEMNIIFNKIDTVADQPESGGLQDQTQVEANILKRTDIGNADRFVEMHKDKVRYCPDLKEWLINQDGYWIVGSGPGIMKLCNETIRSIAAEAQNSEADPQEAKEWLKWAQKSGSKGRIKAMLDLAQNKQEINVRVAALDSDPMLLNCANGTLNLSTFQLQAHNAADMITKKIGVPYDPNATCPLWLGFLNKVMASDQEKINLLQRILGYALTGKTSEQCMFILYGPGANGKTTFVEVTRELLGEYAIHAAMNSLLKTSGSQIRNDIARLNRSRLVSAVEVGMGKQLDEALVKQLTGGDQVTARFLYHENFEFKPQFKIVIAANHKPEIRGADNGIWRRIHLIPFDVSIPPEEIDKELVAKLRNELPGILAWAVQGCLQWTQQGLNIPESIARATADYRAEMDSIAEFLGDRCSIDPGGKAALSTLYNAYKDWSDTACQDALGKKAFGHLMRQKGHKQSKSGSTRYWVSLKMKRKTPVARSNRTLA